MGDGEEHDGALDNGILESLTAPRRRVILAALLDAETEPISFDDLVDDVVEGKSTPSDPEREAVATTLHHSHLPKLADEGLITYEAEHGIITTTPRTTAVTPYLQLVQKRANPNGGEE